MLSVVFELYQIWYEIHTFVFTVYYYVNQPAYHAVTDLVGGG